MTIEELNIKISADAEDFKKEIAAANSAVETFRKNAETAGKEITAAFAGLIETNVSSGNAGGSAAAAVNTDTGSVPGGSFVTRPSGMPSNVPAQNISGYYENNSYSRTASVLDLDTSETVIGAVSGGAAEEQPINITTSVELDGDKIGESVNVYNMRRNRITNGMYS